MVKQKMIAWLQGRKVVMGALATSEKAQEGKSKALLVNGAAAIEHVFADKTNLDTSISSGMPIAEKGRGITHANVGYLSKKRSRCSEGFILGGTSKVQCEPTRL
jgi:hypothetical protein